MFALSLIVPVFITVRIVPPDYPNHPTFKDLLSVCGARQNCIFRPALQDSCTEINITKKRLLHIVLSESAAVIFKIKRIIKQFKKSHPDIIIVNPKPLSRKTQGLFLCLEVIFYAVPYHRCHHHYYVFILSCIRTEMRYPHELFTRAHSETWHGTC